MPLIGFRGTLDFDGVEEACREIRARVPSDYFIDSLEVASQPGALRIVWRAVLSSPKIKDGSGWRARIWEGTGHSPAEAIRDTLR